MNPQSDRAPDLRTFDALAQSPMFHEYQRAFTLATGMPLELCPPGSPRVSVGPETTHRFCRWVSSQERACGLCNHCQHELERTAQDEASTVVCPFGLRESAIPVKNGHQVIGFLRTGKVVSSNTARPRFRNRAGRIGVTRDLSRGEVLHANVPIVSDEKYAASIRLLSIFAEHLSRISNEIVIRSEHLEPPLVAKAREYIEEHEAEHLSLPDVARAVNTTPSYLCRLFKRSIGLNFTEYLRRRRLSRAKTLLINPQMRVSEVAFAAGFQSLTQFNRAFQRLMGQSPTEFRNKVLTSRG